MTFQVELCRPVGDWPVGFRGTWECYELGLYELHEEFPLNGFGVPFDVLLVVETTPDGRETRTPYREYFALAGREATCPLCRRNTVTTPSCRAARRDPNRRVAQAALEALRQEWVLRGEDVNVPFEGAAREGSHPLHGGFRDVATACQFAQPYTYDYDGVHVAPLRDVFAIHACGFRAAPGAGADAISYDGERTWPGPRWYVTPRRNGSSGAV